MYKEIKSLKIYRITEYRGRFAIQVKTKVVKSFLKSNSYITWRPIDRNGNPMSIDIYIRQLQESDGFYISLKSAQKALSEIKKGVIYHEDNSGE